MTEAVLRGCEKAIAMLPKLGKVVELGACNVNGSVRPLITCDSYLGVDIQTGPGVDVLGDMTSPETLAGEAFDLVVCTETLEHVGEWADAVRTIKRLARPGGHILVSVPCPGFPYHGFPLDWWRFTAGTLREIFADVRIVLTVPIVSEKEPEVIMLLQNEPTGVVVDYDAIDVMMV